VESASPISESKSLVAEFLQNLVGNQIAFTSTTTGLLDTISEHQVLTSDPKIAGLILAARGKLFQIERYRPVLKELLEGNLGWEANKVNDFVMVSPSAAGNDLFAVYESSEVLYGFVIPFELLDQQARTGLKWDGYNFGYEVITRKRSLNPQGMKAFLEFEGTINPCFPNEVLLVRPKNPDEIHDFVFMRKLITYLGLTLLVAAMIIGLYMLVQDVNRKKKMARLRTDFVANVTHELKTPLTSINMFADSILLNRYRSDEGLKKYARIILKESEKLKRMVNNILEFARQENNKVFYELREENIAEIIHQVMEEMDYWLYAHNFEVQVELDESLYAMVDAEGLKQVLSNLITNAIKYSPEDKRIAIRSYMRVKEICIDVEDHGIGIPQEQQDSIFKKFYRVSEEPGAEASGTGLGLTVSKEIIEAMNGTLTVRSSPGKGSIFTITLYTIAS
jgi:signal transduction histidine kinase